MSECSQVQDIPQAAVGTLETVYVIRRKSDHWYLGPAALYHWSPRLADAILYHDPAVVREALRGREREVYVVELEIEVPIQVEKEGGRG